jgi:hypothetical protein
MSVVLDQKKYTKEFGDFQTPTELSLEIISKLNNEGLSPASFLEPTCGKGSFIFALLDIYPSIPINGIDINPDYIHNINKRFKSSKERTNVHLEVNDFFEINWKEKLSSLPQPVLVIGNPPWITVSDQGLINGKNIPQKSNLFNFRGIDSITGKSNFDISEWMIFELLKAMNKTDNSLAMLCKVSVARRLFRIAHLKKFTIYSFKIYLINAEKHFNASVDACLLLCRFNPKKIITTCDIHSSLNNSKINSTLSFFDKYIVNDYTKFKQLNHLIGKNLPEWRSGIKHDAKKVMEFEKLDGVLFNGFKEKIDIEPTCLFPLLKGSDLIHNRIKTNNRFLLVTQRYIGENTDKLKTNVPKTWDYLKKYESILSGRASSIYRNKPPFSIFGVGEYTFCSWKIAISGFHKKICFRLISLIEKKPVVFDDTCYFLPCLSKEEATLRYRLLQHPTVSEFLNLFIHWKSKRPITKQILQLLDLQKLRKEVNLDHIQ